MLRIGPLEYLRSLGDQFDELAAEFEVGAFGVLVPGEVATELLPLFLESVESLPEEIFRDEAVKAILIEAVHQDLLLFDLGPDFLNNRLVVGALFFPALGDSLQQPGLGVVVDGNAGEQGADLVIQLFLADVGFAADLVAGAVVVDIAFLLELGGEVSATGAADQQPLVCEVMFPVDGLLVGAEGRLHGVPEFSRDQRLVAPGPGSSLPAEVAVVERVLEQQLQLAEADELALFRSGQAFIAQLLPQRLEGVAARCVEFVGATDHRRLDGIRNDDLAIAFARVVVAERSLVWKPTFLDLLRHALLHLVREVVDVVLGQQHHHPEREFARRVVRKVLLPEQRLRR